VSYFGYKPKHSLFSASAEGLHPILRGRQKQHPTKHFSSLPSSAVPARPGTTQLRETFTTKVTCQKQQSLTKQLPTFFFTTLDSSFFSVVADTQPPNKKCTQFLLAQSNPFDY
jgi:hypothetical protein